VQPLIRRLHACCSPHPQPRPSGPPRRSRSPPALPALARENGGRPGPHAPHSSPLRPREREAIEAGVKNGDPLGGLLPSLIWGWTAAGGAGGADRSAKNLARLLQGPGRSAHSPGGTPRCCSIGLTNCRGLLELSALRRGLDAGLVERGVRLWPRSMCCCAPHQPGPVVRGSSPAGVGRVAPAWSFRHLDDAKLAVVPAFPGSRAATALGAIPATGSSRRADPESTCCRVIPASFPPRASTPGEPPSATRSATTPSPAARLNNRHDHGPIVRSCGESGARRQPRPCGEESVRPGSSRGMSFFFAAAPPLNSSWSSCACP